jgi:hypothetical protein
MCDHYDASICGHSEHQAAAPRRAITRRALLGVGLQLVLASSAIAALSVHTVVAGDEDNNPNDPNNDDEPPKKPPGDKDENQRRKDCVDELLKLYDRRSDLNKGYGVALGVGELLAASQANAQIEQLNKEIAELEKQCGP